MVKGNRDKGKEKEKDGKYVLILANKKPCGKHILVKEGYYWTFKWLCGAEISISKYSHV